MIVVEIVDLRTDRSVPLDLTEKKVLQLCTDLKVPDDTPLTLSIGFISGHSTRIADVSADLATWIVFMGIKPGITELSLPAKTRLTIELSKVIASIAFAVDPNTSPAKDTDEALDILVGFRDSAYALDYLVF